MDLTEEERSAMEAALKAAIAYAARIEYATDLIERGSGHLSTQDEEEIIERDSECAHALVEAVRRYRALNDRRGKHGARSTGN
jgi:hypothetical protein